MKKITFSDLILFENEDYIVINKPPHVSTLHDRKDEGKQNIIDMVREYCPDAQVAHRLDRETSGALAIAKNPEAYRHLAIQFEKRKVLKLYHAVVDGLHDFKDVLVDKGILPQNAGYVIIDNQVGKPAQTYFNTLKPYRRHTLLECKPLTGRMHQIRIHLATLKASIVHDMRYGGTPIYLSDLKKKFNLKKDTDEQPLISRFALHAYELGFHFLNDEWHTFTAPYPKDIKALIAQLEKNM
ncbi:MAG: RNA pseudouridine synthase [Bacteroidetes bacterium]|nr:MAG: RNA pseudouridine synthase [Bacteroidota bacterium]